MERPKKGEKLREYIIVASVILFILSYGAFITFRIIKGEWVWRPIGYIALGAYTVFAITQAYNKEPEKPEIIVMLFLLAFNFLTQI